MKLVITGALGHIGSRLVRELFIAFPLAEIVLMDNLLTQRYCSLFNLPTTNAFRFLESDVLTADLPSIFDGATAVVHLAAITDATNSFQNSEEVNRVNIAGTERVARACLQVDCPLIFPSTTSVYGSQSDKVDEDCPILELKPQSPYADSKLKTEQLLQRLQEEQGLKFVTCRFGTIFGTSPGMRFHTAINKFCWQSVMGQPLTVWETALHQHRPYLDLSDAVDAIKFIIQQKLFDGHIYNVVTTNASINHIINLIQPSVPDLSITMVSTEIMNQLSYHVSNTRFQNLGFTFKGDLAKGIRETIDLIKAANQRSGFTLLPAVEGA